MLNKITQNGGHIKVEGETIDVIPTTPFDDGSGFDDTCPYCLHTLPEELADIVQYGIISDMHEFIYMCTACGKVFALEVEIPT
jgi:uncharacterized protein with PIN domain